MSRNTGGVNWARLAVVIGPASLSAGLIYVVSWLTHASNALWPGVAAFLFCAIVYYILTIGWSWRKEPAK